MQKLDKRWKIILYGCSGLGLNMINMIMGSYLCSALLTGGFAVEDYGLWTFIDKDLVVAAMWGIIVTVTKIFDGIIDIPLSNFTDNLRTKWGRRRPALLIGLVPTVLSFLLFATVRFNSTVGNTIWFAVLLAIFYASYTLTMLTYYATFSEIVATDKDRVFLANTKSICDVVYFSMSFALVPVFVNVIGMNISWVALIFLPLAATMLIPLFLIKEKSTLEGELEPTEQRVGLIKSIKVSLKNKSFLYWLIVLCIMNIGLQLFLSGINEFFSVTDIDMTFVMASAFAPIPVTLMLYNKFVKTKGVRFAYQYSLLIFSVGMTLMFPIVLFKAYMTKLVMTLLAICCGIIVSFGIGAFFSVIYTIPSQLAAEERDRTGYSPASMYFAVQGLAEAIGAGIASGAILVTLKQFEFTKYITLIVGAFCMIAFVMAFFLPKRFSMMGKEVKTSNEQGVFESQEENTAS